MCETRKEPISPAVIEVEDARRGWLERDSERAGLDASEEHAGRHASDEDKRRRDRETFKVFRFAAGVVWDRGGRHVESCKARDSRAAEDGQD